MFALPSSAVVDRPLVKERFYAGVRHTRRIKRLMTDQVHRITWSHKLAPDTINVPASSTVPEIEVIRIDARVAQLDAAVFGSIDRAIPNPTVHVVRFDDRVRWVAAPKRPRQTDDAVAVIGDYLHGPWQPSNHEPPPLPTAIDLGNLYTSLLRSLMDLPARDGETLSDHVDRHAAVKTARRDAAKIERKIRSERQFNRRAEWNARLREVNETIQRLTR